MNIKFKEAVPNLQHEKPIDSHCEIMAELGETYTGANGVYFEYGKFTFDFDIKQLGKYKDVYLNSPIPKEYNPLMEKMGDSINSIFTNHNSQKPYHYDRFDTGNLRFMVCFREGTEGGGLNFPEFNIQFPMADQTILIYRSGGHLHGVTPTTDKRTTVVFFSATTDIII